MLHQLREGDTVVVWKLDWRESPEPALPSARSPENIDTTTAADQMMMQIVGVRRL